MVVVPREITKEKIDDTPLDKPFYSVKIVEEITPEPAVLQFKKTEPQLILPNERLNTNEIDAEIILLALDLVQPVFPAILPVVPSSI